MSRRVSAFSLAVVLALCGRVSADGLAIGDAAPKLEVKEFVKGDAVKSFEKGKIYVVEFWATWCGPCRTSIPHVSDLQKKNKDAVFIGVSVWERDQSKVKPFVEEMGEKMSYRVAMDEVGDGNGSEGKMAKNWMTAAEQDGIPAAFIVNGEGKIAWIGHPMQMDKPLEQIVAGKWDLAKATADFKLETARKVKTRTFMGKLQTAFQSKDEKAVASSADEAVKDDPVMVERISTMLNDIAWRMVEKPGDMPDSKLMKFALGLAEKADKLVDSKQGGIADTLAKAYYENGNVSKALETQERAIKLAKGTPLENDESLKERLELYKKKSAKQ